MANNYDYDPARAHEYYEKHKKLKGRKKGTYHSTKGWSRRKKEQWAYVKEQLRQEHSEIGKGITAGGKSRRAALSAAAKEKIAAIRESIKNLPKEQKKEARERIKGVIADIRGKLKVDKSALTESVKGQRTKEKEDYAKRKDIAYQHIKSGGK